MSEQPFRPLRVVIVGGGTAGWMTAAGLRRQLAVAGYSVTLIESDEIGTVGVGEATLPHIKKFNDLLGIDEAQFMRATRATFKLGIQFCDWDRPGDRYIHPFGAFGEPWGGVEFQHHWMRAQQPGPLQDYSFAAVAARSNVFEFPSEDSNSIRSTYSYEGDTEVALLDGLEAPARAQPRLLQFAPGRRDRAWSGNCVAIGLASGFLEPLESTSIFLIQAAVIDLINLMPTPGGAVDPRLANEFNRLNEMQYERIRDFLVLHYVANRRTGEPLWDYLRSMRKPDSLEHKLALFRSRAAVPNYQWGLFSRDSWLAVLVGQGIQPQGYDRLADCFSLPAVASRMSDFRKRIQAGVEPMTSHDAYIAHYCAADSEEAVA